MKKYLFIYGTYFILTYVRHEPAFSAGSGGES